MVLEFLDIMLILIGMLLLLQICGRIYLAHEQGIACTAVCCRGSQPTTKYAIILICLSVIVAFTGNVFLSFVGVFTGCICLRLETFERSPDLIYMMSLVTATAAVLYALEFLADKVPGIDSLNDALHTFIRIPAGALLAMGSVSGVAEPWQMAAALVLGGVVSAVGRVLLLLLLLRLLQAQQFQVQFQGL